MTSTNFAVVGLTGGIASGKSTVSSMFRELGVPVIDADQLARFVVEPGQPANAEIRARFGEGVFQADGTLDREALGKIVFSDPDARRQLNAMTHPRIAAEMAARSQALRAEGHPWVIYDAALIVENQGQNWLGGLIVVSLAREHQLRRLVERDGGDEARAAARIDSQLPLADKVAVADWVIDNGGAVEQTRAQVEAVHAAISKAVAERGQAKNEAPVHASSLT